MTSFLLMASAGSVQADVISLTTSKAAGEKMTIALNPGHATFTWGNGTTETVSFNGQPTEVAVKDAALTITTELPLTRFYAPANGINTLNVTGATNLLKLFCPNNAIAEIDLSKNKALTALDLQSNSLTTLNIRSNTALEHINCAQNDITTLTYYNTSSNSPIRILICSDNQIQTLGNSNALYDLQALWANGNNITTNVSVNSATDLRTINVSSNQLPSLIIGSNKKKLTDVWAENNQLKTFNLSSSTPALSCISLANNQLTDIKWNEDCKNSLRYVYLNGNQLYFTSFPQITSAATTVLAPQDPFLFLESADIDKELDMEAFTKNSAGDNLRATFKVFDSEGNQLKKSKTGDYYNTSAGLFTFYKAKKGIYVTATTGSYKGVTLTSQPFDVNDPTGINDAVTADGINISVSNGYLSVETSAAYALKVYDVQGRCIISENISAGDHAYALAPGLYIVNGKKYLVK